MACLNQYYTKHMIIYLLVACLFQVVAGRATPDQQTISVDVPDTSYMENIFGSLTNRARSMASRVANRVVSAYSDSADVAAESGKNMMAFLHKMNESAVNFGTSTANRMGQMVKNGSRSWSGLLSSILSSE
ncbi:uncharacterized protein LOC107884179 [Acyrthosiphon pisum]|uniref:Uncharacterized protein n=1 Tax=Acyrthosiphon pisum TaxID=7029 RepID=A0A8R2H8X2_ACYPI|nr:uncharacterized protein LOC107884179 [Acyrthosiphon pisum]|eukprot:XP_016661282.1 PREDICTED: uncharacterized protein LOC107884179 [Acyrthosiphon pisum]